MRYTPPDLQNCDKEPIHIIGKIQSFGYLLVLHPEEYTVVQSSENIDELVDLPANEIIGHHIDEFFPFSFLEYFNELLTDPKLSQQKSMKFKLKNQAYVLSMHRSDGFIVMEIEPDDQTARDESYMHYNDLVQNLLKEVDRPESLTDMFNHIIEKMRLMLGFDRMMVYQFDEEDRGKVIAELAGDKQEKYLGLHFPASDIPQQARKLYIQNLVRGIWNVYDEPVAIFPEIRPSDNKPLDLSQSFLRSVSPIHVEYLKNMHLRASFSISLVARDRLWGMILCHNSEKPVRLNIHQRKACSFISKILSLKIMGELEETRMSGLRKRLKSLRELTEATMKHHSLHQAMEENHWEVLKAFSGNAYALYQEDSLSHNLKNVEQEWIKNLIDMLHQRNEKLFVTHELSKYLNDDPQAGYPAGLLAVQLSAELKEYLLLFRPEQVQEVDWAGKPEKRSDKPLNPRASFDKWTEEVKGQSLKWLPEEHLFAEELRDQLISSILNLHREPRKGESADDYKKRLKERNTELEKQNKALQRELTELRQLRNEYQLNKEVAEEKTQMQALDSLNDDDEKDGRDNSAAEK